MQPLRRLSLFAVLLAPLAACGALRPAVPDRPSEPVPVFLARHAEKTAERDDPRLTEAGQRRAADLARTLDDVEVTHVFSSQYRRTRSTAQPLADARGLAVEVIDAGDPSAQVAALDALPAGSVALVVGHSNTVPDLVRRLGGSVTDTEDHDRYGTILAGDAYDRLFAVTRFDGGARATTLELRFGAPRDAGSADDR